VALFAAIVITAAPAHAGRRLLIDHGHAIGPVTVDARYLVWETGPLEGLGGTALRQRDDRTGKVTTLARGVVRDYGLASWSTAVVYGAPTRTGRVRLVEVRHDGSRLQTLSPSLLAPIDSRGPRVAWAEQRGGLQRVVVRDLRTGRNWIAAVFRRCRAGACYRVDAVALARRGVVFDRGAIGPFPSRIVRRAFTEPATDSVTIPNDPQPDVVPSSAGALYYVLGRGWYRWDFGRRRPRPTPYRGAKQFPLLRYEDGRWFVLTQAGCEQGLIVRRTGGAATGVATAGLITASAGKRGDLCVQLTGLVWWRRHPVTAWAVIPAAADENHSDAGLVSLVLRGREIH
jgi:hypothetical protein